MCFVYFYLFQRIKTLLWIILIKVIFNLIFIVSHPDYKSNTSYKIYFKSFL